MFSIRFRRASTRLASASNSCVRDSPSASEATIDKLCLSFVTVPILCGTVALGAARVARRLQTRPTPARCGIDVAKLRAGRGAGCRVDGPQRRHPDAHLRHVRLWQRCRAQATHPSSACSLVSARPIAVVYSCQAIDYASPYSFISKRRRARPGRLRGRASLADLAYRIIRPCRPNDIRPRRPDQTLGPRAAEPCLTNLARRVRKWSRHDR